MPRLIVILFFLIGIYVYLFSYTTPVNAQAACTLVAPQSILNTEQSAAFLVDVGDNTQANTVDEWQMEFDCAPATLLNTTYPAVKHEDGKRIFSLVRNTSLAEAACEFNPSKSPITIKIKAKIQGAVREWCRVSYKVTDNPAGNVNQCTLLINPTTGITPITQMTVEGKNIVKNAKLVLFFDKSPLEVNILDAFYNPRDPLLGDVGQPSFPPKPIPANLMTPGQHIIALRSPIYSSARMPASLDPRDADNYFYPPACSVSFTVGTQANPGGQNGVGGPGAIPNPALTFACDPAKGNCTKSGGFACDPVTGAIPGTGGILTAIGCVPTEPVKLVQGILKFTAAAGGGIALLIMVFGAFEMITSSGNPESIKKGQDRFTNAIIGLLFIIFSTLVLQLIGVDILNIPGLRP